MRFAIPASLTLAVVLLIATPGIQAQRGGGHGGSGGGHSFGGGSFGSHSSGGGFSSAPRSFSSMPRMNWNAPQRSFSQGFSAPRFSSQRAPYFGRGPGAGYRQPGAGNRREPFRYRSPYHFYASPYGYGGLPYELGYPDFNGYADSGSGGSADDEAASSQESPSGPSGYGPDDSYRPSYAAGSSVAAAPVSEPVLTVVFRDGHTQQIRNYALTRASLIVLDDAASGRQQSISLDQIDLPATEQSAQNAGLDFHPPSA
jgi:hypothetical protein